ncbi:MAG: hypothetical protein ACRAS9_01560 [Mycoplasma sp.]
MSGKMKLFALFSTLTTTALDPIENLLNVPIQKDENDFQHQSLSENSIIKEKLVVNVSKNDGNLSPNPSESIKSKITDVLTMLQKYYFGYEYDFTLSRESFTGAKKIASFFYKSKNMTNQLNSSVDEIFENLKTELKLDLLVAEGEEYQYISDYLTSLYINDGQNLTPREDLEKYKNWSISQLQYKIGPIAKAYYDNYYGYASSEDLAKLSLWFGVKDNEVIDFNELKINILNYALSNVNASLIKNSVDNFATELGIMDETPNNNTILGRELISIIKDVENINQMWRNNYYGVKNYAGEWFNLTYDERIDNWKNPTTREDVNQIKKLVTDNSQTLKETLQSYKNEFQNLINFKNYQLSEISKLLQPIVDFYNQWYMGYQISLGNELEKLNQKSYNWEYDEVFNKITSSIIKNKNTSLWEFNYIDSNYGSNTKQNAFRDEQMNALVLDINDNLIGGLFKNNYFGYNFGWAIPLNIQKILSWQNSNKLDAIWNITNWIDGDWGNQNTSTYKIFTSLDEEHNNNLLKGRTFKNAIDEYILITSDSIGQQFINFQLQALSIDITKLISRYREAYLGYSNPVVVNSTYLPGLVKISNDLYDWNLNDTINTLKLDNGYYQDDNRLSNGRWLYNNALVTITAKLTSETDNFSQKEKIAFDNDLTKIISEYKSVFRGFMNDVNGNKLTYKTLGDDDALTNGVFISKAIDVSSSIFDKDSFKTFVKQYRNSGIPNIKWEADIIKNYRNNISLFKNEQTQIFRNFLLMVSEQYYKSSLGYVATNNGTSLNFPNLPFWTFTSNKPTFDIDKAVIIFDQETYNQQKTPIPDAKYRLSYDVWEKYMNNLLNYEKEQYEILKQDVGIIDQGFVRKLDIFNFLQNEKINKSWSTNPTYRGNFTDDSIAKSALKNFFSQFNPNLSGLNNIDLNWYSSTAGGDGADWENINLNHSFTFLAQYGIPLQLFYDPLKPKQLLTSILDINTNEYLLKGKIDNISFLPSSQDGNIVYDETIVITKDKQQFIYKLIPSTEGAQFKQVLFAVADLTNGTPNYTKAQKITIMKNSETENSIESSLAVIEYDLENFSFSNISPNFMDKFVKNVKNENKIENIFAYHSATKFIYDSVIKITVGYDQISKEKICSNVNISDSEFNNENYSINELISKLPNNLSPINPITNTQSSFPIWVIPITIVLFVTFIGIPLAYVLIRKYKKNKIVKIKNFKKVSTPKNFKKASKSQVKKGIEKSNTKSKPSTKSQVKKRIEKSNSKSKSSTKSQVKNKTTKR